MQPATVATDEAVGSTPAAVDRPAAYAPGPVSRLFAWAEGSARRSIAVVLGPALALTAWAHAVLWWFGRLAPGSIDWNEVILVLYVVILLAAGIVGRRIARSAIRTFWPATGWPADEQAAWEYQFMAMPRGHELVALVIGLAIAAQLFAAVVLVCHIAWILATRRWGDAGRLLPAWLGAAAIGVAANASIYYLELTRHGLPPPLFNPTFPRDLLLFLVGAPVLLSVALWPAVVLLGVWTQRREVWLWTTVVVVAIAVTVLWLVLKPAFLYPRFFIFLVPACAFLVAAAVKRWWVLGPVVVAGAIAAVVGQAPTYLEDPLALPEAAAVVESMHATGETACVVHSDEQILSAYTSDFAVVTSADQLGGCDAVVVVSWGVDLSLRDEAARELPNLTTLPAYYPAVVLRR